MPSIKEYNQKLLSLRNTEKMTRTMKLVSMSKLYRAQEAQRNARLYAERLTDLIHRLAVSVDSAAHPLLTPHGEVKDILVLLITSDKGLCGSYNNALFKQVSAWIQINQQRYRKVYLSVAGKRGYMFFRNRLSIERHYEGITARPDFIHATQMADDLIRHFLSGQYQEVYLAYNIYHSPLSQTPKYDKILPIDPSVLIQGIGKGQRIPREYLFEPAKAELLKFLIPKYLYFRIYFALLENAAGEHGARMTAMDSAAKNTSEMIRKCVLLRNRARQAAITTELIEIVCGAEALKS
jgi:F-type H+-transporting ATPase subunit gamma